MTEATIQLVASMYEARRAAKFILGDNYFACMDEIATTIRMVMEQSPLKPGALEVAATLAKGAGNAGASLCIIAAAVEMIEPSARREIKDKASAHE